MKNGPRRQQGMTLLIAMIMLTVITIFVVSMVRLSNTNAAIVGNMRAQKTVDTEAQQAIEVAINNFTFFDHAIQKTGTWADDAVASLAYATLWANYKPAAASAAPVTQANDINIFRPQCTYFETSHGYSALSAVAPQDTYWDLRVTASDSVSGAGAEIHQGVQIRLPAGNCN
jgi:Tfp pilus assembly protein PilX